MTTTEEAFDDAGDGGPGPGAPPRARRAIWRRVLVPVVALELVGGAALALLTIVPGPEAGAAADICIEGRLGETAGVTLTHVGAGTSARYRLAGGCWAYLGD